MGSLAGELARRALRAMPMGSRVRGLIDELEPLARAKLEALGKRLVVIGEQLEELAGPKLLAVAAGGGVQEAGHAGHAAPHSEGWARVTFTISHAHTRFGEDVFVAGDQEGLGRWEVSRALPLAYESGGADGTWTRRATLPALGAFQYKYLAWDPSLPPGTARWEADQPTASGNREARTAGRGAATLQVDGRFRTG